MASSLVEKRLESSADNLAEVLSFFIIKSAVIRKESLETNSLISFSRSTMTRTQQIEPFRLKGMA